MRTSTSPAGHWVSRDVDGSPLAHHSLEVDPAAPAAFADARCPAAALRRFAAARGLGWSKATWPTLIRPESPGGRGLGVDAVEAGVLLVQRACDADGTTRLKLETTVRIRRASTPLLESLTAASRP